MCLATGLLLQVITSSRDGIYASNKTADISLCFSFLDKKLKGYRDCLIILDLEFWVVCKFGVWVTDEVLVLFRTFFTDVYWKFLHTYYFPSAVLSHFCEAESAETLTKTTHTHSIKLQKKRKERKLTRSNSALDLTERMSGTLLGFVMLKCIFVAPFHKSQVGEWCGGFPFQVGLRCQYEVEGWLETGRRFSKGCDFAQGNLNPQRLLQSNGTWGTLEGRERARKCRNHQVLSPPTV